MARTVLKSALLESLGLGPVNGQMKPLDSSTAKALKEYSTQYDRAMEKSREYVKTENGRFGGCPMPGEEGSGWHLIK